MSAMVADSFVYRLVRGTHYSPIRIEAFMKVGDKRFIHSISINIDKVDNHNLQVRTVVTTTEVEK